MRLGHCLQHSKLFCLANIWFFFPASITKHHKSHVSLVHEINATLRLLAFTLFIELRFNAAWPRFCFLSKHVWVWICTKTNEDFGSNLDKVSSFGIYGRPTAIEYQRTTRLTHMCIYIDEIMWNVWQAQYHNQLQQHTQHKL